MGQLAQSIQWHLRGTVSNMVDGKDQYLWLFYELHEGVMEATCHVHMIIHMHGENSFFFFYYIAMLCSVCFLIIVPFRDTVS